MSPGRYGRGPIAGTLARRPQDTVKGASRMKLGLGVIIGIVIGVILVIWILVQILQGVF